MNINPLMSLINERASKAVNHHSEQSVENKQSDQFGLIKFEEK